MGLGQKHLDAQKSSLIYLLEPVFATLIAVLFFGEFLLYYKIIGGGIILLTQVLMTLEAKRVKITKEYG